MPAWIEVTLKMWEVATGSHIGAQRQMHALARGLQDRMPTDDPWTLHVEGACAEIAVAKHLDLYWEPRVNTFKDPDIGRHIQVRRRSRHDWEMLVRDDSPNAHVMVHVTGATPVFRLHGFLPIFTVKQHPEWRANHGQHGWAFFVPQRFLRPLGELLPYLKGDGIPF